MSLVAPGWVMHLGFVIDGLYWYANLFTGQQIVRNLRESLFSSIVRQEVGFFDKTRTGELINRLSSDTTIVGRSLTDNLSDGLRSIAQAGVGVSMMVRSFPASVLCFCSLNEVTSLHTTLKELGNCYCRTLLHQENVC